MSYSAAPPRGSGHEHPRAGGGASVHNVAADGGLFEVAVGAHGDLQVEAADGRAGSAVIDRVEGVGVDVHVLCGKGAVGEARGRGR